MEEHFGQIIRILVKTIFIILFIWILITFVFGIIHFKGNSMYPAIRDGDLAIMFKLEEYKINEVVAYESDGEVKLGRIVGMPGSEISYDEGGFMVDGIYPAEQVFYPTEFDEDFEMPYYIDEDHYFIMNDFRSDKNDSRTFGAVEKNKLKGKLIYLFRRRGF